MEEIYEFLVPGNYTYNSDIEVTGGNAQLTNLGSSTVFTENFNDAVGLTFGAEVEISGGAQAQLASIDTPATYTENFNDAAGLTFGGLVEISGGAQAQLALQNDPGIVFTEDFANDTDFTYNASNTEFTGGLVRQIQKAYRPTYYLGTFFANYDSDINGNYGDGVLTGTAVGGASVSAGKLDLKYSDSRYVTYPATLNANHGAQGCIRLKYTPNYSGAPGATRQIIGIANGSALADCIYILHTAAGNIWFRVFVGGAAPVDIQAAWITGIAGTEYELEFNWDLVNGASRMFVNGNQLGATSAGVGVRATTMTLIKVGCAYDNSGVSNAEFNDLIIFSSPQHTANYAPSAYGLAAPKQPTFYAGYDYVLNGDWGDGVLTGTAVGGAAISGGKLDLKYNDTRYITYPALGNASTMVQEGCIRFKLTPNYNGTPASDRSLISIGTPGSGNNHILIRHLTGTGNLYVYIYDNTGVVRVNLNCGAWSPTSGTEYEIELNFNLTTGATRLFINGTQFGGTNTGTGTRDNTFTTIAVGSNINGSQTSNFEINDLLIFSHVKHTANYTPSWTGIRAYEYDADIITLPEMHYTGAGTLVSFDTFTPIDTNGPRYTLQIGRSGNYLYWDGGAWSISNNTYSQANPAATFAANIASISVLGEIYGQFRVYTQNNIGSRQSADNINLSLTAQTYSTTNPTIDIDLPVTATATGQGVSAWTNFSETVTEPGSDTVTFTLSDDNGVTYKYWDGGAWSVSSGFAQSNDGPTIDTNIATFPRTASGMKVRVYLHSNDGTTTPNIANLDVDYDDYIYSTANPTVDIDAIIESTVPGQTVTLNSFTETSIEGGSDLVTYQLSNDAGVSWLYWDGAAWSAAVGYAQSNHATEVNAELATFPINSSGLKVKVFLHSNDGSTTPAIQNLDISYTDFVYSVLNPTIVSNAYLSAEGLTSFAATVTETGSDTITFTVEVDAVEYYWDGAAWATGGSFANSNTAADINTNVATLDLSAGVNMRIIAYIHSNDGSSTPILSDITVNYDYYDIPAPLPNQCLVTGYLSDVLNNPIVGATVSVRPSRIFTIDGTDTTIFRSWITVTTDANGYFEAPVFPSTDAAGDEVTYDFKFTSGTETIYRYNLTVPDQAQIDFGDL